MLAAALAHAIPSAVTASGDVTLILEEANDIHARALTEKKREVAALLAERFDGVGAVTFRQNTPTSARPARVTDEMIRTERLAALRKRDPVLGAAIDALDLDVVE